MSEEIKSGRAGVAAIARRATEITTAADGSHSIPGWEEFHRMARVNSGPWAAAHRLQRDHGVSEVIALRWLASELLKANICMADELDIYAAKYGPAATVVTQQPDLLPCPFCGGSAEIRNSIDGHGEPYDDRWMAACRECGCIMDADGASKEEAATTWNTRASVQA